MSRTAIVLIAIVVVVSSSAAHAAIPRYSTNPNDFVSARLQHFWVNGEPFRFVGYNVRGLVHYGGGDMLYDSQTSDREANLAYMESVGAKVARVFMSCRFTNTTTLGNRLDAALQVASQHNIRLIVVFTDEYYSNFCPLGDGVYYGYLGNGLLNQSFFGGGYMTNYVPLVNYIVNRFKNDPTVFAWQLGNELKCPWNPADLLPFSHDMAQRIRAIDSMHMVSHGTAGRAFGGLTYDQGVQLYQDFDFLTIHPYNGNESLNDSGLANQLGKPLLVSEAAFDDAYSDRAAATDADISKWVSRGARGYMNWGLMVVDNGDGDISFGIDRADHWRDWDAYTEVYSRWASILANTTPPAPERPTGLQASDGTYPDRVRIDWQPAFPATEYAVFRTDSSAQAAPSADVNLLPASLAYQECGHNLPGQAGPSIYDGVVTTKWCCLHNGINTPGDHWIAFDLGSECSVMGYVVKNASTGGEATSYNTREFYIESGPSINGPWTQEFYYLNSANSATCTLIYGARKQLRYIRLRVTKPNASADWAVRIPEFEVWGTPGAPPVQVSPWLSATTFTDTSVARGKVYDYCVRARNAGGESPLSYSDSGYASAAAAITIGQAKALPDSSAVYITGATVSAAFADGFYVGQSVGSGIGVLWSGAVAEGSRVDVLGHMRMTSTGERKIEATSVQLSTAP